MNLVTIDVDKFWEITKNPCELHDAIEASKQEPSATVEAVLDRFEDRFCWNDNGQKPLKEIVGDARLYMAGAIKQFIRTELEAIEQRRREDVEKWLREFLEIANGTAFDLPDKVIYRVAKIANERGVTI